MDEPPSPLLKSRIPRKTTLVDCNLFTPYNEELDEKARIYDLHCPLQKGIIYYFWDGAIFERNIHSSGKYEPRTIVLKHPSWDLRKISFTPIKGNRILLFAKYYENVTFKCYLHLSIHEIRADNRVGPTLWAFNGSGDGHFNTDGLELIKTTENALGIALWERFDNHWKLFDISTSDNDTSDKFPLIESGRIDFDENLESKWEHKNSPVILSPTKRVLLNPNLEQERHNEMIDIHCLDSGRTNNMNFSFVTRMSIPFPKASETFPFIKIPVIAFSADGSRFSVALSGGGVSVWDIRSKLPFKTFTDFRDLISDIDDDLIVLYLEFSSGKVGKEALTFVEHYHRSRLDIIHVIDATSFETEEILLLQLDGLGKPGMNIGVGALFFDPNGGTLYAELFGTLYEWDLQKNEPGPEWWIGE
ncbi:hypothetical protein K443DRAFT_10093 [Laccaria amethystina LaAM-08-1]|uniref:Uncharacterized protein n=1 Tax=Laccaria amethystina LaAM-08-1 TaxID=1095629 RepID=A0A0C9WX00_9AGAR|nr:hypothetical protein K443DRAFT_10093 [Laccaria amethystina LaAM-08-1]